MQLISSKSLSQYKTTPDGGILYTCSICGGTYVEDEELAPGHDYGDDGLCTVCGEAMKIEINMVDTFGDGWNGNAIKIYADDELIDTATVEEGFNATWICDYDPGKEYTFHWISGSYANECSFEIKIVDEAVFAADTETCHAYPDGQRIYPVCEHIYDEVHVETTCTKAGFTTYICQLCGYSYVAYGEDAFGHDFDDDGICTVCGETFKITISMSDSYGDGWNGNAIEIYADDELIGTATIEDVEGGNTDFVPMGTDASRAKKNGTTVTDNEGYSATWTCEYDSEKEYKFYRVKGEKSHECHFDIIIGNDTVYSGKQCLSLTDGQLLYPEVKSVYVAGVELFAEQYLDLDGNVSELEPNGGFAYFDGSVLTLSDYCYVGALTTSIDNPGLISTKSDALQIKLLGTNTLGTPDEEPGGLRGGIVVGSFMEVEKGALTVYGTGTLNMTGSTLFAVTADNVTLNGGTWNITAYGGISSSMEDSAMTVNGGELNITAVGHECAGCLRIGHLTVNDGRVVLAHPAYLALDVCTLSVNGGYLEVKQGGMEACNEGTVAELITLAEGVSITAPEGATIVDTTNNNNLFAQTIHNADGTVADAFVIRHESYEDESDLNGWVDNKYYVNGVAVLGWYEIDGSWYYFDEETGYPKTGLSRVPYPEAEIAGNIYAPDADAIAYCEAKGETFIDENEGWFFFHDDGRFLPRLKGMLSTDSDDVYMKNGFAEWNPGLVTVDGENYYYFIGDEVNGGNKPAVGNYYVGKDSTDLDITIGGVYTFDENGKLCEYDGITDIDGTLYYYESYQLMLGMGLVEIDGSFYYVRSDGALVVGQNYWISNNNGYDIPVGEYEFDEDGMLIFPENGSKNGIYKENGAWYYYENVTKAYGKGLIDTALHWYDENGEDYWGEGGIIYVRSNGELAVGTYYITNIANYTGSLDIQVGERMRFNRMGILINKRHGIVEENGSLYYYLNDRLQYNAGVIQYNGNYYVRSNGEVVNNRTYWVTNVRDSGVIAGMYTFDANGVMQNPLFEVPESVNGIVAGYYYVDGEIAYGAGLVYLEAEGCYIYVRSNGMIATGRYWITKHNGYLPAGVYDFGTDGKYYP